MGSKYNSQKAIADGIVFASRKEARRYSELKLLERAGAIRNLELQPRFPLFVNGTKVCTYVGDFSYFEKNARVIEDTKGYKTREYINKRKLLMALFPLLDHREV